MCYILKRLTSERERERGGGREKERENESSENVFLSTTTGGGVK